MDGRNYNPYALQNQQLMDDYENQMRLENGAVSQYSNSYGNALNSMLAQIFGGGVAEANPAPPTPPVREKRPKGFGRPYVMSLQEYVDNYLPYNGLDYQNIPKEELPQR